MLQIKGRSLKPPKKVWQYIDLKSKSRELEAFGVNEVTAISKPVTDAIPRERHNTCEQRRIVITMGDTLMSRICVARGPSTTSRAKNISVKLRIGRVKHRRTTTH